MKKSLIKKIKRRVGALKDIKALLLLASNLSI